jgi:hypothetical protein
MSRSLQRHFRAQPHRLEPRDIEGLVETIRFQAAPSRTALYLHLATPERGVAVEGRALPNLPGSVRGVFASSRRTPLSAIRDEVVATTETGWVIEGAQQVKFAVSKELEPAARTNGE